MTQSQIIACRLIDRMLANMEVESLGYFAARCEVAAEDCTITIDERRDLLERAEHYRDLQIVAMTKF